MPVEPPPSRWQLPPPAMADEAGIVGVGADLKPGTLLQAYRRGIFPMPVQEPGGAEILAWWSPDPRGIIPLDRLRVTRSLRRSCARHEVLVDTAFEQVIDGCAAPERLGSWITPAMRDAYIELHRLGWAHSVEAWADDGTLAGGLYGVAIGGLFAGESMFHRRPDASKVALVALVELLAQGERPLLDVQWTTEHLATLGAVDIPRDRYLRLLPEALAAPLPPTFA